MGMMAKAGDRKTDNTQIKISRASDFAACKKDSDRKFLIRNIPDNYSRRGI
jgi:hypothetical protein